MSYSFIVRGMSKAETLGFVRAELDKIAGKQPVHKFDVDQAYAVAEAFVAILPDSEQHDVNVAMYGSLTWLGTEPNAATISASSVSVTASLVVRG